MSKKRFLKKFNSQSDSESQKDSVMGMPHVVLFDDTKELLYASEGENPSIDYSKEYFTIVNTSEEPLTIQLKQNTTAQTLNYKLSSSEDWLTSTALTVGVGEEVQLKGEYTPNSSNGIGNFYVSGSTFNIKGNVMSLLYGDDFIDQKDLSGKDYAFYGLFYNCTTLVSANELILPATTLAKYCYGNMFNYCTNLVTAPELPATTLADYCYRSMFSGTNVLPDCSNIDFTSKEVVASGGLKGLFSGTKVTDSNLEHILPKNDNGKYCLPCTTLTDSCYSGMFQSCKNLVDAPALPATTLASSCYSYMFQGCSSLVNAPALPATTLVDSCYYGMFSNCTSLVEAPQLLATTLASSCYSQMFSNCKNLVTAPELPATTLAKSCYSYMFGGCSKLNNITMLATDISASSCLYSWVSGVASEGTFTKHPQMTSLPSGSDGIPNGWTIVDYKS